jgi:hypothetical protein
MARRIGLRTMALTALLGSAAAIAEIVRITMHLNW